MTGRSRSCSSSGPKAPIETALCYPDITTFRQFEMGARRPFFVMATSPHDKERELYREVSRTVSTAMPGVEVLALEITGRERFCVYVDQPGGVDHALCERVSGVLRPYLDRYSIEVSSPGLERPLRTREHFRAAEGRTVKVKTEDRKIRGEVLSAGARTRARRARADRGGDPREEPHAPERRRPRRRLVTGTRGRDEARGRDAGQLRPDRRADGEAGHPAADPRGRARDDVRRVHRPRQ